MSLNHEMTRTMVLTRILEGSNYQLMTSASDGGAAEDQEAGMKTALGSCNVDSSFDACRTKTSYEKTARRF
jgi:hypothetical protein